MITPELLSPAGNMDNLKAAIQNGADAVYVGLNNFSARAYAQNFTTKQLEEAVNYAHTRGVLIYVALNTLLDDNELKEAVKIAILADQLHVDSFIIQDIGLAKTLKDIVSCPLHASTQMTIYNVEGVETLKKLGFSRCILSRELSLNEINDICNKNIMETEIFCHGALCMSYSGQCLLSYAIGGRSGNKGQCAQPCRLKYSVVNNNKEEQESAYILSPADLCSLSYLDKVVNTKITSLKIEGRLKNAEYTGLVTSKYRHALDIIQEKTKDKNFFTQNDINDLSVIFSRGSFTKGYHFEKMPYSDITYTTSGRTGLKCGNVLKAKAITSKQKNNSNSLDIFELKVSLIEDLNKGDGITVGNTENGGIVNSIYLNNTLTKNAKSGQTVLLNIAGKFTGNIHRDSYIYKTYDADISKQFKERMQKENIRIPIKAYLKLENNKPLFLTLTDEKRTVKVKGTQNAEVAKIRALSKEDILKQISKLGNTIYILESAEIDMEDNLFLPLSELSTIRREAIDILTVARIKNTVSELEN